MSSKLEDAMARMDAALNRLEEAVDRVHDAMSEAMRASAGLAAYCSMSRNASRGRRCSCSARSAVRSAAGRSAVNIPIR